MVNTRFYPWQSILNEAPPTSDGGICVHHNFASSRNRRATYLQLSSIHDVILKAKKKNKTNTQSIKSDRCIWRLLRLCKPCTHVVNFCAQTRPIVAYDFRNMDASNNRQSGLARLRTSTYISSSRSLFIIFVCSFIGTTSAHGNHMAIPNGQAVSDDPIVSIQPWFSDGKGDAAGQGHRGLERSRMDMMEFVISIIAR